MSDLVNYLEAVESLASAQKMLAEAMTTRPKGNNNRKTLVYQQVDMTKRQLADTLRFLNRIVPDRNDAVSRLGYEADPEESE